MVKPYSTRRLSWDGQIRDQESNPIFPRYQPHHAFWYSKAQRLCHHRDTKPVLNKLSRLITLSFLDEDFLAEHYDDIVLPDGAKELLQHHGRFTRSTLESCVEFSESIPLQFFVDILEHVKIVAAIDQTSEYFMPCALPYATEMPHSSHPWVIRLRVSRGVDEKNMFLSQWVIYLPF